MDTGNARAVFAPHFRRRMHAETSEVGKCLPTLAQNVDPQRRAYARCVSSGAGRWTAVLNHIYMEDELPTREFRLDMFSHFSLRHPPHKYDQSVFYMALPACAPCSVAEGTRTPEWHHLSLPAPLTGQEYERKVTLGVSSGGDTDQYGVAGPYAGLDPRVRRFSRRVGMNRVWRVSFKFEIDPSRAGGRTLGHIHMLTPGNIPKLTTGHLRDSVQIWVGSDGSDSVASFHYTFVDKQPLKRTHGHYILSVDDVVHLGDVEDGILIESRYAIKLRTHLAPTGTRETAYLLPELVLSRSGSSEPPHEGSAAPAQQAIAVKEVDVPQLHPPAEDNIDSGPPFTEHLACAPSFEHGYDAHCPMMGDQSYFEEAYAAVTFGNVLDDDSEVSPGPYAW